MFGIRDRSMDRDRDMDRDRFRIRVRVIRVGLRLWFGLKRGLG